ncbi:MAG: hypothetical protein RLY86_3847 [Pseudomonadota bacterium]|jgi:hypothetical protein
MLLLMLRRLGAHLIGPPRVDAGSVPPGLMADVGLTGRDSPLFTIDPREAIAVPPARPFSFRIHPASELIELGDRSGLASLPGMRQNNTHPLPT